MEFYLKGKLKLSKMAEDAFSDLKELFSQANKTILVRGAPEGQGADIVSWHLDGSHVELEIKSPGYIRPHDALLRLKNEVGKKLGAKYHLGVRSISVDIYRIEFEVEKEPLETIDIPFASSVTFKNNICTLLLENVNDEILKNNYVDRMLKLIREKALAQEYLGKGEHWELMWASPTKDFAYRRDPTEDMLERGWIKQGPTKGKWSYRAQFTKLIRVMEKIAMDEVLEPLGFEEIITSHIVPFDIWKKTGHMQGSPNEFYYVSQPRTRDIKEWERFQDLVKITGKVPGDELMKMIAQPKAGICYAQCPAIYWSLQGSTISNTSLPLLMVERTANSCRYESGGRHGIERVDEFHRIEPVYIGTEEQLCKLQKDMLERYKYVFNEILELEWRMAWVTPFYMQQSGGFGVESNKEKIKGTIDFEAYMPYRGTRKDSEWLEFQNFSIVGEKYTQAFNIKGQKTNLWSGCSGIGLERWAAVFLAQKGLNPEYWPKAFREIFGDMPKGIHIL